MKLTIKDNGKVETVQVAEDYTAYGHLALTMLFLALAVFAPLYLFWQH